MPCRFQDTITKKAFLASLQISDSFFPVGGFNHSFGLETYIQEGIISSGDELKNFLEIYLNELIKYTDLLALYLAHSYTKSEELESLIRIDNTLTATKSCYETKMASIKMGKTLLNTWATLWDSSLLREFSGQVKQGLASGNHATVYGAVTSVLGIPLVHSLISFTYNSTANMLSASIKLMPLGQKEAQMILCSLHDIIIKTVQEVLTLSEEDLGVFAPAYDIRCMTHERLYSRLFMS
ncbi:MAG: urease accessory protein UreF [Geminocystis sp.]|nr:urease accessory protein UreF [Geminocystis sp.]